MKILRSAAIVLGVCIALGLALDAAAPIKPVRLDPRPGKAS